MPEHITVDQAAKILEMSRQWITEMCRKGILEAKKFGRDWMVSKESALAYKARRDRDEIKRGPKPGRGKG